MSKLILTNEVDGLGSAGDVVEVRDGYARNYLIPQGYAVAWTRGGEKQVASIRAARDARAIATHDEAASLKAKLEAGKVKLTVKAGAEGRLFGSVRAADVATAVAAAGLGELDKRRITLPSAIKSTGDHEAVVRLLDDVVATIPLQVVALKK
ncbi:MULTISPECIES: 50S ribosomal protein L9 [unclassified Microbacterium]|uniref:50S ribosomal protein L9 n=1 Tax=unclassified Microbacterium TaxID=2609290 RepID=UPI00097F0EE1|nr:50S ribosomal protein L9 [Microbacterium sp. JB110]RCS60697.1 50S ribosomal protein L9 [Microbacterium sp. JB110]SJM44807.1 LSU ribosomal protein L9p [Frigoribacterium sp. JB110]